MAGDEQLMEYVMNAGRICKKRRVSLLLVSCFLLIFFSTCDQPLSDNSKKRADEDYVIHTEIFFYPGEEVIFHDSFALFSTTIVVHSPDTAIGAFDITLGYDSAIIQYESIYSLHSLVNADVSSTTVEIDASGAEIGPGYYLELCTLTWKALITGITDISLNVNEVLTGSGDSITLPEMITGTVKIVEEIGTLSFNGPGDVAKGADFTNMMIFDTDDKVIREFELEIFYDPEKLTLNTNSGNNGVIAGADGFIQDVTPDYGRINITGFDPAGTGPGRELEFLIFDWNAADSGRTMITCEINKIVTLDDVYIKPQKRQFSTYIYSETSKPIVDIWLEPPVVNAGVDTPFQTSVMLNTIGWVIAAYGIDIYYDPAVIELDITQANGNGIEAGADGFLTVFNSLEPGFVSTAGFDLSGKQPDPELELLRIYWKAVGGTESSLIELDIRNLVDVRTVPVLYSEPLNCEVIVNQPLTDLDN